MKTRLALALFIACAACIFTQRAEAMAWLAAVVVSQLMDVWVGRSLGRNPEAVESFAQKALYTFTLALISTTYSSIAVYVWFVGGEAGKLFALLLPAGSLLNVAMQMGRAPRPLLAATAAPHALYLLSLPIAYGLLRPDVSLVQMCLVSLGGAVFLTHVGLAVRRIQQTSNELRKARDIAEGERQRAETANAAKSDFLATISHEIRTPMNAVVAAAGLLRRTSLSRTQAEHVEMLTHSAELLMGLLKDVLDLSKIESGKLVLEQAEFDLVHKLRGAVQLWRARAQEKGVTLVFEPGDLPSRIITDPLRLQQIVFNLLSNAVKFTAEGRIVLRGGRTPGDPDGSFWIEVEDTGCGMDAEASCRVFEPFEQAAAGTTRQYGGTGLGLSISRRLTEMLGGALTVQSTPGVGSTFNLQLPLAVVADGPSPACEETEGQFSGAGIDVLLAEDHEINQRIVRLILEPLGFSVTVARNGAEAVATAGARPFDVILMDMQMPVMGGVEATAKIRAARGPNSETPVLAFTANAMDEHRALWNEVGVETILAKPVDMKGLVESIQRVVLLAKAPAPLRQHSEAVAAS